MLALSDSVLETWPTAAVLLLLTVSPVDMGRGLFSHLSISEEWQARLHIWCQRSCKC